MSYDWKALAPTRRLGIDDVVPGGLYVDRPGGSGAREIDRLVDAGFEEPIAIFGPAGAGKSTELSALARLCEARSASTLIRLDKELVYSDATSVDDVLEAIARRLVDVGHELGLTLSAALVEMTSRDASSSKLPGFDVLLLAVREIRRISNQHVGLWVDGLEKASVELARRTLANLERLRGEAHVVVVVPTELTTGPSAAVLHNYRLVSISAFDVDPNVHGGGFDFLIDVAARRLGRERSVILSDAVFAAVLRSIELSGGLVRTFLQLLQKSALYAAMSGREVPDVMDVDRAALDQTNFLLRLLKDGDVAALRAANDTNGLEIGVDRRVRYLANGLLLEYKADRGTIVRIAPLLKDAIVYPDNHD